MAILEKKLWKQQTQVNKHKRYFSTLFNDNKRVIIPALMLPAFLMGWRSARSPHPVHMLKQFGKMLLPTLITWTLDKRT